MLIIYHQGQKKILPEGPRFSRNVSKKSILPVKSSEKGKIPRYPDIAHTSLERHAL